MRVPWQVKFGALALIWGGSFLLMKVGLQALAPVQIATLRIVCGAVTVLVTALAMGVRLPRWGRVWAHLFVAGFVLCSLPFTLFPLGEERVSSALAGIGNATTPLSAVLFTLLLLRAERADRRTLLAVVAGFLGVVVILQPWQAQGRPDALGFAMTLLAGASYGLGWTYVKRFLAKDDIGGLGMPAAQLVMAAAQMAVVTLVWWWLHRDGDPTGIPAPWSPVPGSGPVLWPVVAVLVLGVVGTGLAFALQYDVVREVGPTVGATVTYVIPVVAVVLGIVFLHERLQWPQVVGAAVVLAAAVVIGRPRRRIPTAEDELVPVEAKELMRPVPTPTSTCRS
jgi:drug/metabolite transporter (DMT)-like permease